MIQGFKIHSIHIAILVLAMIGIGACSNSPSIDLASTQSFSVSDFPNILNLHGVPDSATDKSVFAFTDMGAWHGYSLPSVAESELLGSFVGPFLMTHDNGTWLSKSLSKLEIINLKNGKALDLKDSKIVENNSYPNKLKQVIEVKNPGLRISTELIFISNRTALTLVEIQNTSEDVSLEISLKWKADNIYDEIEFNVQNDGIKIDFLKNDNIGWISAYSKNKVDYEINDLAYQAQINNISIDPSATFKSYLSQSFCFTEEELQKEKILLKDFQIKPNLVSKSNEDRWNGILNSSLGNLNNSLNSRAHQQIAVKCLQTLNTNWKSAAGALKHDGLFPSYNYEWFNGFWAWDSWKHAVTIAQYDTQLAQDQINAMYGFQDEMGMIADCVYRDNVIEENNWRNTKPPLSAWAAWKVFQKSKDEHFIQQLFPKIEKYHNWWYAYRDINQNGLCEYGSTDGTLLAAKWESGMDNAVRFDSVQIISNGKKGGSINAESVDLNSYLFAEKVYLSKIANALGESGKSKKYKKDAESLKLKIQDKFYNKSQGWYFDYSLENKDHIKIYGSEGWIPLWANVATSEQANEMKKTMLNSSKFATHIPFPTLAADHPKFKPNNGYWRGPVWIDQAYFAIKGLKNYGFKDEALGFSNQIFDRLEGLKNDNLPIRENYHPHTGKGLESNHFSWSAAHLLLLLTDE